MESKSIENIKHENKKPGFGRRGSRRSSIDRNLTRGSITGNLWALTWPTVISNLVMVLGPLIDIVWVGSLGSSAIAGVGISGMAVMMIDSARMGLNTGTRALLARSFGADDRQMANHIGQQAIVVSSIFSLFTAAIGIFFAETILILLGVEPDVVREGAIYMRILFVGSVATSFGMITIGIMQASGDAVTPMTVSISARIFHIFICPFLVFGWWIFPSLGVRGAALTNVISHSIVGIIGLWILFTGRSRLKMSLKGFSFDTKIIWRMVKIGIPASITGMERSFANFILVWLIVPFGTAAVAAHSLAQRIDMFVTMPAMGLGQASGVLAAQNLGAGQPDRAEKTGWTGAGMFTCASIIISIIIWFWAESIVHIFNEEPELIRTTSAFLRISIVSYLVFGLVVVLMNCLNGVGDTYVTMWTTLLTMWLVQVPVAFVLPKITGLGVYGVRWGIVAGIVLRTAVFTIYFKNGRWKRKEV